MATNVAPANIVIDDLHKLFGIPKRKSMGERSYPVYYPFYISAFNLDKNEELLVSFDGYSNKLVREEDGIKIYIAGTQATEMAVKNVLTPRKSFQVNEIYRILAGKLKRRQYEHIRTDLVYFPCIVVRTGVFRRIIPENAYCLINTSSGTRHAIDKKLVKIIHAGNDSYMEQLERMDSEARNRRFSLPSRSLTCFSDVNYIKWLINKKQKRKKETVNIKKIVLSYTPFWVFKYYARRPRALKTYMYCSVSATTGSWSIYTPKVLEYDEPKDFAIKYEGDHEFFIDDVEVTEEYATEVAKKNIVRVPGVINVVLTKPEIIYFPIWTVHLIGDVKRYKLEICGVTGYIVYEGSNPQP